MLFKTNHLKGIKSGAITLAFRRWTKPAAKKGSLHKTAIGQVEIVNVTKIQENKITDRDARSAGFENRTELLKMLKEVNGGAVYKIKLRFHSKDPRIALRKQTKLSIADLSVLEKKLKRLDALSKTGPWTDKILTIIKKHPHTRAVELAERTGFEKMAFKLNVRKLKNLGLTISHEIGYEISPLGRVYLQR